MDDAQQNGDATAPDTGNVMDRVLETFDGLADNATAAIGTGVSKIGAAGAGLADKAGKLAGDISDSISGDSHHASCLASFDHGREGISSDSIDSSGP